MSIVDDIIKKKEELLLSDSEGADVVRVLNEVYKFDKKQKELFCFIFNMVKWV